MSDNLPGGGPAFEQPDFSAFEGDDVDEGAGDVDNDDETLEEVDAANAADDFNELDETVEPEPEDINENVVPGGAAKSVLEHIAVSIVDDTESVVVETKEVRGQTRLYLHVAPSDMGRIIGRRGRTAQAVRTLVRAAAAGEGNDVFVEIVD